MGAIPTRRFQLLLLVFLAGIAGCSPSAIPPEPPPPQGILELNEEGWQQILARQRGRVVLVNFWATWCEPCREEYPALVRLHNSYRAQGFSLVAVSMDEPESVPAIERFLKSQGAQFGSYRHNFRDFGKFIDTINPRWGGGIPASFLFDRQGRLVESWQGATSFEEFQRSVQPLLR